MNRKNPETPFYRPNRILHVLIITTGADAALCTDGSVDKMIQQVLDLKKNPVLVLGPEGDDVLLHSHLAEHCDLAFDPNFSGNIFSSLNAGLHATTGPVIAMTLQRFSESGSSECKTAALATATPENPACTREQSTLWTSLETETLAASRVPKNGEPAPADVILLGWPIHDDPSQAREPGEVSDSYASQAGPGVTQNINQDISFSSAFPLGISAMGALKLKGLPASTAFSPSSHICFAVIPPVVPSTSAKDAEISCPLLERASQSRSA